MTRQRWYSDEPFGARVCMVKRGEIGGFGAARLQGHGLPVGSETLGLSSRVRRAASSLPMQPAEPVVAKYGPTKTAIDHAVPGAEGDVPGQSCLLPGP